ncbi:MAG TPA: hypothetical protein VKB77_08125 [Terriglobales bacterium]|nr:hypothetical protein [Terriglobales bacterium]
MASSSSAEKLYRTGRGGVILVALAVLVGQTGSAQYARRETARASKGPRAVGLLELSPNGKARLMPVTIMYDGKFYDASAYKASPVPMALESGTVYEGVRTGVPLGLFTVTSALQAKDSWLGAGHWEPAESVKPKKKVAVTKPPDEDADAPPVLRRSGSAPAKPPEPAATPAPAPKAESAPAAAPVAAPPAQPAPVPEDNDHPALKRGQQAPFEEKQVKSAATPKEGGNSSAAAPAAKNATLQIIPAISDAHGPEPLPFKYQVKPDEEAVFRKKVLAIASDEVNARAKALAAETIPAEEPARKTTRKQPVKPPQPAFDNVDLRIFDLTNANEPVLVLTATARMPQTADTSSGRRYFVTLVARSDIYGDLHKAFVNISDTEHLDILPRMELVDAVDADGDGRGELLFRQISDAGNAYVIYRVIGDTLYALYQGTPTGG